jgi:hypothetical protein
MRDSDLRGLRYILEEEMRGLFMSCQGRGKKKRLKDDSNMCAPGVGGLGRL